ncbi:MAG: B12-binding domain-containing radical SAM protein [Promethearchaeota archaeon]
MIVKDWRKIDFSFALVYPNISKIGMSSYSIRLLYYLINSYKNIACERFFLPDKVKYPAHVYLTPENQIRSMENKILLNKFDIVGFSLQFENDFKNILWILENSLIPITVQARQSQIKKNKKVYPIIIAGGPVATSNPMPFSSFIDLFFIGDSETNLDTFFKLFKRYVENEINYFELLNKAKLIDGIYVPSLNNKVKRAVQRDLDNAPIPKYQTLSTLFKKKYIFENKLFIEINRGCPFECKFCISSYHNSPFRNRSFNKIKSIIDESIKYSSFNTISLIGACVSGHSKFREICEYIIDKGKRFTIPSIRIEHLNSKIIQLLEIVNTNTITIAPETGSQELRYSLGKHISNDKIFSVIKEIKESKIKNIKFYFLIGLPNEKEEHIEETIKIIKNISDLGFNRGSLRININPLIPKLNTPYERKIDFLIKENIYNLRKRYQKLKKDLQNLPSVKLKFQNIRNIINNARLQAIVSLGDQEISFLLVNYYLEGANFGALRKAEKISTCTIDEYLKKIKRGYSPWRIK